MTTDGVPTDLATFIEANLLSILGDWETFASSLEPLHGLDADALRDHACEMLRGVAADMRTPQSEQERFDKSVGLRPDSGGELNSAAGSHASARFGEQLTAPQLVAEFRAMRASVLQRWAASQPSPAREVEEITRFNEAIDQAVAVSVARHASKVGKSRAIILGILAHDLRSPLNAVSFGMHAILRNAKADPLSSDIASKALKSIERMDLLIRDLLAFTLVRLGSGLDVRPEPVDLQALCHEAVKETRASHPGRTVHRRVEPGLQGEWDAARIRQLAANLLTNALQHGDPAGEVTFSARPSGEDIVIEVHNHGPAIPDAVRRSMFIPMSSTNPRWDGSSAPGGSPGNGGVGLGLYISQEIVGAHGGDLTVRSTDTEGTTFVVRLPKRSKPSVKAA